MRRLFSTFARGCPGVGLLVLRLVAGSALVMRAADALHRGAWASFAAPMLAAAAGLCLIGGLWTPVAGSVAFITAIWFLLTRAGDPMASVLLATIGAALALVGPGAWSIDARLFGWRRIEVHDRTR